MRNEIKFSFDEDNSISVDGTASNMDLMQIISFCTSALIKELGDKEAGELVGVGIEVAHEKARGENNEEHN